MGGCPGTMSGSRSRKSPGLGPGLKATGQSGPGQKYAGQSRMVVPWNKRDCTQKRGTFPPRLLPIPELGQVYKFDKIFLDSCDMFNIGFLTFRVFALFST